MRVYAIPQTSALNFSLIKKQSFLFYIKAKMYMLFMKKGYTLNARNLKAA
jgi:hypothetical protein